MPKINLVKRGADLYTIERDNGITLKRIRRYSLGGERETDEQFTDRGNKEFDDYVEEQKAIASKFVGDIIRSEEI